MTTLRRVWDLPTALLSLLLAAFTVIGWSFYATDSAKWFASSPGAALGSAVAGLGIAIVLYVPIRAIYFGLDRLWDARAPRTARHPVEAAPLPGKPVDKTLWAMFGVILGSWLVWLLLHWPGNIDSDTVTQKLQWLGLQQQSDHHPWFDTMVFGWFWDLGSAVGDDRWGLFVFLLLQEAAIAFGVAFFLAYLARLGISPVWRWVLAISAAVLPVFFEGPSVMVKDTFGVVFWIPFLVLFTEALRTRGRSLLRWRVAITMVVIVCLYVLAKRTNVYLIGVCLLVLLIVSVRGSRWKILAGGVVAILLSTVVWSSLVLAPLHIQKANSTDILSLPLQQTARIVRDHGAQLPQSERDVINKVLRYDGLAKAYTPRRSDAVKGRWKGSASTHDKIEFAKVWLQEVLRYPGTALSATADNTFDYFAPTTSMSFQNTLMTINRYIPFWTSRSLPTTTTAEVTKIADDLHNPSGIVPAMSAANDITAAFSTGNILMSKALWASWIPLLAFTFFARRRNRLLMLATVPVFMNLAFLIASPLSLPRYVDPSVYASLFLLGLMLTPLVWMRRSGKPRRGARAAAASGSESDELPVSDADEATGPDIDEATTHGTDRPAPAEQTLAATRDA